MSRHMYESNSYTVNNSYGSFQVNGGNASGIPASKDVRAEALSPSGRRFAVDVIEKPDGTYSANFTPSESGDWQISILHGHQHIHGSPFSVRVHEPARPQTSVTVHGLEERRTVGRLANFSIETQGSGSGDDLTVDIIYNGRSVPAEIDSEGLNRYHVSFVPVGSGIYTIHVYYDGVEVTGSPYKMEIIDASEVEVSGDGLTTAEVNRRATFYVNLGRNGMSRDLRVHITTPRNVTVPANIIDGRGNVTVEFVPTEVGEHYIDITYFNKPIAGNPFRCQVFDWSKINVNLPVSGIVDRAINFDIDASQAGAGSLEITVNDGTVPCNVQNLGNREFRASFIPVEPIVHVVRMTFNGYAVPGSPWRVDVRSPASVSVTGSGLNLVSVGRIATFEVHSSQPTGDVVVNVTSPTRRTTRANVVYLMNGMYRVEYIPMEIGNHLIEVIYNGMSVAGSPFTAKAFNVAAIAVSPVGMGVVGVPVEFSIDVSQAGEGQLEITVNHGMVRNSVRPLGKGLFAVTFTPQDMRPHLIDILFNGEPIPQGTITVPIMNNGRLMSTQSENIREVAVNRQSFIQLPSTSVSEADLIVRVTSPSGELVPAKMVAQPDGDFKVEYSSKFTGRHTVEILHNGQAVMGSPFFVEIYDPNKIRVEGTKTGMVNERMEFDINRLHAGKADLVVKINGPRGNSLPFTMNQTAVGEHVVYTPRERGPHLIYITYGGLDVPGCPIRQEIFDSSLAVAYGDGLTKGIEDQEATFFVDVRGQRGDLDVRVDGPNSIAKCVIEPEVDGRHRVRYIPVEVGIYSITVKWNGREIEGSPFHPKIVDPRKVYLAGSWESVVDTNNQLRLKLNEMKTLEFDTRLAGPGQLTADVRSIDGAVPVEIVQRDRDRFSVSFIPRVEGEYTLRVMWNGALLPRFPVVGVVTRIVPTSASASSELQRQQETSRTSMQATKTVVQQQQQQQQQTHSQALPVMMQSQISFTNDKVVLTGSGLQIARVNEHAEFIIDGSNAGPGEPVVELKNLRGSVNIDCVPMGGNKHRCIYVPQTSGAYLLYIMWAGRQLVGSPFKITVLAANEESKLGAAAGGTLDTTDGGATKAVSHHKHTTTTTATGYRSSGTNNTRAVGASRVICTADSLKKCMLGQECQATVDTHLAGRGKLIAKCIGPTRHAICQLISRGDIGDMFTLVLRPQEVGPHTLSVTFNGEHVPGSPFVFRVTGPPDATKVRVTGPGIHDGPLNTYQSVFLVHTKGAGAGELTVKILGPKGAFNVDMVRQRSDDRTIKCQYDPTEPGEYSISVKWSNEHVPGSPFHVRISEPEPVDHSRYRGAAVSSSSMHRYGGPNAAINGDDMYNDDFD